MKDHTRNMKHKRNFITQQQFYRRTEILKHNISQQLETYREKHDT